MVQLPTKSRLPARACVYLALHGAVMISYPRPKAVAVAGPADYHGNQVVLTGGLSGSSIGRMAGR